MRALWILAVWVVLAPPGSAQEVDCANAVAQVEMTFCAQQDFLAADTDLNRVYKDARATMIRIDSDLPASQRGAEIALRDAQRAWITFRDQACLAEAYSWHGGSGEPMIYASCQENLTRRRVEDLIELAQGY